MALLGAPRQRLIDRTTVQYPIVGAALLIAALMLVPQVSPVLVPDETLPMLSTQKAAEQVELAGFTADFEPREKPPPVKAKGILMTGYAAGLETQFNELLELVKRTQLNAVVIDIKDERGEISWIPQTPEVAFGEAGRNKLDDPAATIQLLKDNGIYVIGRIVTFRDPVLSEVRPDIALQDNSGGIWHDRKGNGWLDPYSIEAQNYNIALAVEAIELGFQEIQFDYIRFPTDGDLGTLWSRHRGHFSASETIAGFLKRARAQINPRGAYISADLFGLVALVSDDLGIGQKLELIAPNVDYVSLMLYPSHFNKPEYGIPDPELEPGRTVSLAIQDAKRRIEGTGAKLRPWLQDFTAPGGVPYSPAEVVAQISATEDAGIGEWLLWNARNRYTEDALRPAEGQTKPPPDRSNITTR